MLVPGRSMAGQEALYTDGELEDCLLADLSHLDIHGLDVRVVGGMVDVSGEVGSLAEKKEAESTIRRRSQVRDVSNELRVAQVPDAELQRDVLAALEDSRHYTIYDELSASVSGGVVTLAGRVPRDSALDGVVSDLSKVRGVRAIQNEVRILPYTPEEEKLQEGVAIDVSAALVKLDRRTSSLHVVIENDTVTLSGMVGDDIARRAAEEAARRSAGVKEVQNRLRIGEPWTRPRSSIPEDSIDRGTELAKAPRATAARAFARQDGSHRYAGIDLGSNDHK